MRIFFSCILLCLLCFAGHAQAFSDANCPLYWKAFLLPVESEPEAPAAVSPETNASAPRAQTRANAKILVALTALPPQGHYLYGPESKEGIPTSVRVSFAPLNAFPMNRLSDREVDGIIQERGSAVTVRFPLPSPKKETLFAGMALPGTGDSNPLIYPGPVTFWIELPAATSGLGGVAVQASLSGLLCSTGSCMPASGSLTLTLSSRELSVLPRVEEEPWWQDWKQGENVFISPSEGALATDGLEAEASPFSGGRSLKPPTVLGKEHPDAASLAAEDPAAALARQATFFSHFAPEPYNVDLEVRHLSEALLLGFAAGLLLNLMPCVLPVVTLKFSALMAVSAMTNKRTQAKAFRRHCIIFALGIMTWFIVLALLLGMAGWAWGELFQQPGVIVVLGLVLFLLGLSLFGVYSLPIFDLKFAGERHPHLHAFGSGLLATLLATPCSGPLLGGVLAWAIRQELPVLVLTIASVGIGMSLPYCVLAIWPKLVHLLPRPGAWTMRLEQLLGFFLMGTVVYFTTLLPAEWIPAFLFNLFAVALAAWLWGQIGHLRASRLRRGISRSLAVGVILLATWWGGASLQAETSWETFEPERFIELLGKEPLLLEFTADWCPSCKALEHTTLSEKRMSGLRSRYNMRTIRVDLTRDSKAGKELLKALDSTSIPVVALFPKGEGARRPLVLRDLITSKQLEEAAARIF